jgi:hypothetical protein
MALSHVHVDQLTTGLDLILNLQNTDNPNW